MIEEEHSKPAPSGFISQPLVVSRHFLPTSPSEYIFRVRRCLPAHQFVCVSGNLPELGEWIPDKALRLEAKGENGEVNVWEFPLSLSHLEEVNYRYLVCSELNWRGEKKLIVEQFESTVHPRKFVSSSTAVKGSVPVVVEDGEFGTTRRVVFHDCYVCTTLSKGIVPYSNMFLEKTELIKSVKDQGLVLLSWGERNNVAENIAIQKKLGVDGIIYDGISHFKPSTRDDMIKKGVERIAQSVQAHQPRLTTEVLEEEENEEQGETSSSVASQHVMAAITEDPEPSGD